MNDDKQKLLTLMDTILDAARRIHEVHKDCPGNQHRHEIRDLMSCAGEAKRTIEGKSTLNIY